MKRGERGRRRLGNGLLLSFLDVLNLEKTDDFDVHK